MGKLRTTSPDPPGSSPAPRGYFGLEAIAARMGVAKTTILAWHRRYQFPLYSRRVGPRTVWYTHEALIQRWELERCQEEHRRRYGDMNGAASPPLAAAAAPLGGPVVPLGGPVVPLATNGGPPNGSANAQAPPPPAPAAAPASRDSASEVVALLYSLSEHITRFGMLSDGLGGRPREASHGYAPGLSDRPDQDAVLTPEV